MKTDQLTVTRFMAALLVVCFHQNRFLPMMHFTNVFVGYFYVLSGFVLMISQKSHFEKKEDFFLFYGARAARIYPLFLLGTFLAIITGMNGNRDSLFELALNLTGLQAFFPGHVMSYNYPAWSISVELFFYVCFPFLVRFVYRKLQLQQIFLLAAGLWMVSQCFFLWYNPIVSSNTEGSGSYDFLFYFPVNHLNQFVCGNVLGILFLRYHEKWKGNFDGLIVALSLVLFGYLNFLRPRLDVFDHNGLLIFLFGPIILLLSLNTGVLTKVLSRKPLLILGEISFGLYLLAEPLIKGMKRIAKKWNGESAIDFHLAIAVILVAAVATYYCYEKPAQKAIKGLFHSWWAPRPSAAWASVTKNLKQDRVEAGA